MIKKLTQEQELKIPEYIEKYVAKGSEPIDRSNLRELSKTIWGEEKIVIVGESIQNTIDLIKFATNGAKIERKGSQLDSQLYSQLHSQLSSQLYSQLHSQLISQLDSQLDSQLGSQLHSQLSSQLHSQLGSQLHSQLYSQLGSQLEKENLSYDFYDTTWWIVWLGFYQYAKYIGVKFTEETLDLFERILGSFAINIFVGNVVFICERPQVLWDNGMLSNDQKPAISWKDGTGFYYLDGVHFEKETWEKVVSQKMTFKEIMAIEIADQRTVALKYNPLALINENATLVHKDDRNNELYLIEGKEINTDLGEPQMYFLKMLCPTGRVFIEGVPPEEAKKNPNATDMQALLCGLTPSEYYSMKMES